MLKNVCVFASSSDYLDDVFYKDASELGALLGKSGMNIVYGGSRLGMMYSCAKGVKDNGGKVIAVMPERLYDFGVGNREDCDEFYLTSGMRERKAKMDELSDAVVAIAGGFGTLEEISEMIVQKQLGYNSKPIVILNTKGFYDDLIRFFETIIRGNFAKAQTRDLYYIASTPAEVLEFLAQYTPQEAGLAMKF